MVHQPLQLIDTHAESPFCGKQKRLAGAEAGAGAWLRLLTRGQSLKRQGTG